MGKAMVRDALREAGDEKGRSFDRVSCQDQAMDAPRPLVGTAPLGLRTLSRQLGWVLRRRRLMVLQLVLVVLAGVNGVLWFGWALRALLAPVVALIGSVLLVLVLRAGQVWLCRPWTVGYFTRDASQLVHPVKPGVWLLSDHTSRRRGHGHGAKLRRVVFPHLAAEADRVGATIEMTTTVPQLAEAYLRDMPGLRLVDEVPGRRGSTQFRLVRPPCGFAS